MTKITAWFSKKVLIYIGIIAIVIVAGSFLFRSKDTKQTAKVIRTDLVQEVALTGKVKPNQSVNLGFDKSGRVGQVYAYIGELVKKGQLIASLDSSEVSADLEKALASLNEEQIKLRELNSTTKISFTDASKNLDATIRNSFANADDAVHNKADQFFRSSGSGFQFEVSITSGNFKHYFTVPSDLLIELNNNRTKVETVLNNWQKRMTLLNSDNLSTEANQSIEDLKTVSTFMDKMALAVNGFTSAEYGYDATVNGYKTTVATARSEVTSAISSIVTAKDKLNSAPTLGTNGQFEDVSVQEAKVAQAQASVDAIRSSLNKATIVAPFDGVITLQDAKVGGAVLAGNTLVSLVSQSDIYIEANVSEIHIGKVAVGNPVSITFDAFPAEEFLGEVSYIEPGDVLIDGIVNYKIRVTLKNTDPRIKTGLTTNLKIQTSKKSAVLAIPLYAVAKEGDQSFVNLEIGKNTKKVQIETGLLGNDGLVEVLNGLNEGDIVQF